MVHTGGCVLIFDVSHTPCRLPHVNRLHPCRLPPGFGLAGAVGRSLVQWGAAAGTPARGDRCTTYVVHVPVHQAAAACSNRLRVERVHALRATHAAGLWRSRSCKRGTFPLPISRSPVLPLPCFHLCGSPGLPLCAVLPRLHPREASRERMTHPTAMALRVVFLRRVRARARRPLQPSGWGVVRRVRREWVHVVNRRLGAWFSVFARGCSRASLTATCASIASRGIFSRGGSA